MFILEQRASTIIYNFLRSNLRENAYLLPANICPIVPAIFYKARQNFQFIDISSKTLGMDFSQTLELIKNNPSAYSGIVYVHPYGDPSIPEDFFSSLKTLSTELLIIDDRCLCFPITHEPPMKNIDIALFSTGYAKPVDIGAGGYAWVNDDFQYRRYINPYNPDSLKLLEAEIRKNISAGIEFHYSDSDWLDATIFSGNQMEYFSLVERELKSLVPKKIAINNLYSSGLSDRIQLSSNFQSWRFNIVVDEKEKFIKQLFNAGLFASSHYASLGGIMGKGKFPNSESLHRRVINLFNDRYYSKEQAQRTIDIINKSLSSKVGE